MKGITSIVAGFAAALGADAAAHAEDITIATVNNPDAIISRARPGSLAKRTSKSGETQ